jgi:hypothetical protein
MKGVFQMEEEQQPISITNPSFFSASSSKKKPINAITTLYKTKQKTKHGHR